jgi:N12 class adenine-specific DNA methylase
MPVTRFSEFVIVADLIAMDRTIADVVFKSDLRHSARLRVNHLQMHGLPDKFHPSR